MIHSSSVRRLTPLECERLMGWPDGHTALKRKLIRHGNRWIIDTTAAPIIQADGPRYKQCGNGVATPVAAWIGKRITTA